MVQQSINTKHSRELCYYYGQGPLSQQLLKQIFGSPYKPMQVTKNQWVGGMGVVNKYRHVNEVMANPIFIACV